MKTASIDKQNQNKEQLIHAKHELPYGCKFLSLLELPLLMLTITGKISQPYSNKMSFEGTFGLLFSRAFAETRSESI